MTKREAAIVMAYTGTAMLTGGDLVIFREYCAELLGFPVWTHEFPYFADAIKEKSKPDFIRLCQNLTESEASGNA